MIIIAETRLKFQRNYEPKLRALVEARTRQEELLDEERKLALKSMDALVWKLTAAGIHLERLWEYKETAAIDQVLKNTIFGKEEPERFTDNQIAYLTTEFAAYLIQARAFIGVAQIHTLDACRVSFGGMLTNEKYERAIKDSHPDVRDRLNDAFKYFSNKVFGKGKWGSLLKSLRDRVVHFDRIRPSIEVSNENEQLKVAGLNLERLAQDF